jgi:hypothetical protein
MMKKPILYAFCLTLFPLWTFAAPDLVCDAADYDFGRVNGEPVISHNFQLKNTGSEDLVIRRIQTSCGCTTPGIRSMTIRPGDTAELPVKMDLKGRSGKQTQHITLHSNDPDTPRKVLKVTGMAVPPIEITPRTLNLKRVPSDDLDAGAGSIELTSQNGEAFTVEEVEPLNGRVKTEVIPAEDGLSASIRVTPLPQKGDGHFTDILYIHTSNKEIGPKRVLVMWQISSGVSVTPGVLSLRILPDSLQQQRFIMVRGYPWMKEPLKVTGVTWEGRNIDIDIRELPVGWRI